MPVCSSNVLDILVHSVVVFWARLFCPFGFPLPSVFFFYFDPSETLLCDNDVLRLA